MPDDEPLYRRLTIVIGLGLFFDVFDVFLAGTLGTVLIKSFGLTQAQLPAVLGSSFLGMFVGSTLVGSVADRIGRRPAFLLNLGVYSLFTLAGAFSPTASFLIVTRFLAGIGIGAQMPLSDAYLSEVLPPLVRGRMIALAYTIGFCGVPVVGLSARVLVPLSPLGVEGWRWLFVAGSLGGFVIWFLQHHLVESPRWLDAQRQPRTPFLALFAPANRRRVLMLYVFQIFQTVGYYGFGTMVPLVLASKGFSVLSSLTYTAIAFIGYPVGSALSLFVIERLDRRVLIVISALGMAIFGLALGFSTSRVLIAVFGILYTLISNVFSNAFHVLQGEIFRTAIRGRAAGSAYGLSRLSSAAMPFVMVPVLARYGPGAMFAIIAAAMTIVVVVIGLFAPSTTGRTLEDI
jgi:MFS transporter, putative metabolite:H+ symporter